LGQAAAGLGAVRRQVLKLDAFKPLISQQKIASIVAVTAGQALTMTGVEQDLPSQ
jgi:hypothetical protein